MGSEANTGMFVHVCVCVCYVHVHVCMCVSTSLSHACFRSTSNTTENGLHHAYEAKAKTASSQGGNSISLLCSKMIEMVTKTQDD